MNKIWPVGWSDKQDWLCRSLYYSHGLKKKKVCFPVTLVKSFIYSPSLCLKSKGTLQYLGVQRLKFFSNANSNRCWRSTMKMGGNLCASVPLSLVSSSFRLVKGSMFSSVRWTFGPFWNQRHSMFLQGHHNPFKITKNCLSFTKKGPLQTVIQSSMTTTYSMGASQLLRKALTDDNPFIHNHWIFYECFQIANKGPLQMVTHLSMTARYSKGAS